MPHQDDPQPALGRAICKLRKDAGQTQLHLGEAANIHSTWISRIESGSTNPTWGNVRRIAVGLGVRMRDLAALAEELEQPHS
jgi:transcriptional regulator with XRE-family HTH domain